MVLTGVLHVHTRHSDGSGTMEDVLEAAVRCGLDFVGINDHQTLAVRNEGWLGWRRGVFVLPGAEIHDARKRSHLLVYGVDELPGTTDTALQAKTVREAGGVSIAAHPFERRGFLPGTAEYGWTAPVPHLDGVEVWNYMSSWKAGLSVFNFRERAAFPDQKVVSPARESIDFWFSCGGCAIGGPDAHALIVGSGRHRKCLFPYEMLFSRLRTHLILDPEHGSKDDLNEGALLESIRRGRCFISNALLGDAGGFRAEILGGTLAVSIPGEAGLRVSAPGTVLHRGIVRERFELAVPSNAPIAVEALREGRTWIWCGLPCAAC